MFGSLGKMIGGIMDVKGQVSSVIQKFLKKVASENKLKFDELFVMIKPKDENFALRFFVYKITQGSSPTLLREVTLDEILADDED